MQPNRALVHDAARPRQTGQGVARELICGLDASLTLGARVRLVTRAVPLHASSTLAPTRV